MCDTLDIQQMHVADVVGCRRATEGATAERERRRQSRADPDPSLRPRRVDQYAAHGNLSAELRDQLGAARMNNRRVARSPIGQKLPTEPHSFRYAADSKQG